MSGLHFIVKEGGQLDPHVSMVFTNSGIYVIVASGAGKDLDEFLHETCLSHSCCGTRVTEKRRPSLFRKTS